MRETGREMAATKAKTGSSSTHIMLKILNNPHIGACTTTTTNVLKLFNLI